MKTKIEFDARMLVMAVGRGNLNALKSAGAYIRAAARHSVSQSPKASAPGSPPHTRRGLLKRSLLFGVERKRQSVVVGPAESLIGTSMTAHEFGGVYRRRRYPRRPLMGPTLSRTARQLPKLWENSVKP